jgi:hypothetical protein
MVKCQHLIFYLARKSEDGLLPYCKIGSKSEGYSRLGLLVGCRPTMLTVVFMITLLPGTVTTLSCGFLYLYQTEALQDKGMRQSECPFTVYGTETCIICICYYVWQLWGDWKKAFLLHACFHIAKVAIQNTCEGHQHRRSDLTRLLCFLVLGV